MLKVLISLDKHRAENIHILMLRLLLFVFSKNEDSQLYQSDFLIGFDYIFVIIFVLSFTFCLSSQINSIGISSDILAMESFLIFKYFAILLLFAFFLTRGL